MSHEEPVAEDRLGDFPRERPLLPEPYWRVGDYVSTIENAWTDNECYRMLISDLSRRFHQSSRDRQEYALAEAPRLTGTPWDCLLAATVEHIAITHDHPVPEWCDEPERFSEIYWMPLALAGQRFHGARYRDTPAAFLRHGIMIGGRELRRTGREPAVWFSSGEGAWHCGAFFGQQFRSCFSRIVSRTHVCPCASSSLCCGRSGYGVGF